MRALAVGLSMAATLVLAGPASAARTPAKHGHASGGSSSGGAATTLYISGGGFGHGIGMSQYGAYGYALHGWTYQQILAHDYTGTALGTTNPAQNVRVLLGSGLAAFAGATRVGNKQLNPSPTYDVVPLANGSSKIVNQSSRKTVGTFSAPLTATGPGLFSLAGVSTYRGALEFRPNGSGRVYTVNVVGLDDYVQGVIAAEMPSTWSAEALKGAGGRGADVCDHDRVAGQRLYDCTTTPARRCTAGRRRDAGERPAVAATRSQIVTYNGARP